MDPGHIMQVGMAFFESKTLLSAVELGVFTELASQTDTAEGLGKRLELHERGHRDFFDGLVALGFLERNGDGPDAVYSNAPDSAVFLDRNQPTYIGGILEMANARLYRFWADLTEALRTGAPQNEIKSSGQAMFDELYADPARLEQFMHAMAGISAGPFHALAETFDFSRYATLCDVGGATGQLSTIGRSATRTCAARRAISPSSARSPNAPLPQPALPTACRRWTSTSSSTRSRRPTS